jgi:hypothetical protein
MFKDGTENEDEDDDEDEDDWGGPERVFANW